jgi:deoxyribodipyrimidine photo-lyase
MSECSPSLNDLGYKENKIDHDERSVYKFIGGEEMGLKRCTEFITGNRSIAHYAKTRNELLGPDYSAKLSPWLANGCISIRSIYHEVKRYEKVNGPSESTKKFIDELFWRDFCRYFAMKYGNKIFSSYGTANR